jgi:hypothetical protein
MVRLSPCLLQKCYGNKPSLLPMGPLENLGAAFLSRARKIKTLAALPETFPADA